MPSVPRLAVQGYVVLVNIEVAGHIARTVVTVVTVVVWPYEEGQHREKYDHLEHSPVAGGALDGV